MCVDTAAVCQSVWTRAGSQQDGVLGVVRRSLDSRAVLPACSSLVREPPKDAHRVAVRDAQTRCTACACSDYLFKMLLVGDSGVGKSCLLLRFAVSRWRARHRCLIGRRRDCVNEVCCLRLWLSAGIEIRGGLPLDDRSGFCTLYIPRRLGLAARAT